MVFGLPKVFILLWVNDLDFMPTKKRRALIHFRHAHLQNVPIPTQHVSFLGDIYLPLWFLDAGAILGRHKQRQTHFTDMQRLWNCWYDSAVSITKISHSSRHQLPPGTTLQGASSGHPDWSGAETWLQVLFSKEGLSYFFSVFKHFKII